MEFLLIFLVGYTLGSIPFALVIGKGLYDTDVRQYGSGNLGASNAGRVLGRKAGIAVMLLDLLKATLTVWIASKLSGQDEALALAGLAAALGHCYPLFATFRGGKAVATMYGYLLGMWIFGGCSLLAFFGPLCIFIACLYMTKIVSLSSMVSAIAAVICMWLGGVRKYVWAATAVFALLVIYRHRDNIRRILKGTENKINWM